MTINRRQEVFREETASQLSWHGVRFPNPKSDLQGLVSHFLQIGRHFENRPFSFDDMTECLVAAKMISSSGATGKQAMAQSLARASRNACERDLSRDPLYNQVKMMSEIYRMLGWCRPSGSRRNRFILSHLGQTLISPDLQESFGRDFLWGAVRECLLAIVFPNANTANKGVKNNRFYPWVLMLASQLNNKITRDEIILSALSVRDDLAPHALATQVEVLQRLRDKSQQSLLNAVTALANQNSIQLNTLRNYTRIPNMVLSSPAIGWATKSSDEDIYGGEKLIVYVLTDTGKEVAANLANRRDIRQSDLDQLSFDEAVAFADFGYYKLLLQAGIPHDNVDLEVRQSTKRAQAALAKLEIKPETPLLFNPELQVNDSIHKAASQ